MNLVTPTDQRPEPLFAQARALFDAANAVDPNLDEGRAKELLYAERMSDMLARYQPDAAEVVQLAVRAQHIERWKVPRSDYPMHREGYLAWRSGLYKYHARRAGEIMRQVGYGETAIAAVEAAVGKRGVKVNPDTQLVEDVAALVFIEHYMLPFAGSKPDYDEEKWLVIIRKTWKKMSEAARTFALSGRVRLPEPLIPLIQKAIATKET
ncbi:MAG: DUF4202 domain-containing protein [Rhodocyclaceae bacterium]|jgi:hypothetical protein|nr:DUF4202 domain-containing protein [Rhodocyclaceae bacterium]MBK6906148.1 DUF4202 domain-containing protein [Rhodocyclaceae bacterium]